MKWGPLSCAREVYLRSLPTTPRMRILLTLSTVLFGVVASYGQVNPNNHWVEPYTTKDGVYVPGHYSTDPNYTNRDNYSTYPNVNPWTGQQGTVAPDNNLPNQQQQPGAVSYSRASGGDPIWVATMPAPVQYRPVMQRRVLTPEEQAAREAARQAHRQRVAAHRANLRQASEFRARQRKADAALRKMKRDAERDSRKARRAAK